MSPNEAVRQARKECDLTLEQFSDLVGIAASDLSRIENGLNISPGNAIKLARGTGQPLEVFYPDPAEASAEAPS